MKDGDSQSLQILNSLPNALILIDVEIGVMFHFLFYYIKCSKREDRPFFNSFTNFEPKFI